MKFTSIFTASFLLANSLILSSLPAVLASDDVEGDGAGSKKLQQQQEQQEERKLLLSCERICIFWCHCDNYICVRAENGRRMMMEMLGLDPDTTDLDLFSEDELRELELKAHTLVHNTNADDEHHRALLFGLFGRCEMQSGGVYDKRYLSNKRETSETIPKNPNHALQLIDEIGGNPEATYSYQHNVIDNDEAKIIIDYMESHHGKEYKTKEFNANDTYEFYYVDMTGTEFLPLIGKERMQEIVNLMQVQATPDHPYLPITGIRGMYLPPDPNKHLDYHMDDKTHVTLIIELNEGFEGGEIVYLTGKDGAVLHPRSVGSAFLHGPDMVHGLTSHDGKGRYALYILSDMNTEADPALTEEALSMA